ncbi:MAG: hypothetical protein J6A79_07040, partial [Clostridia bacterium]|nr:hypothetical protein [Clostridia bacterium]
MPVIGKHTSKAQFVQACMDMGWVAPGDVTAMSAAYDFLKNTKGVDTKAADAFLEKVVENPIWMLEDRTAMLDEMKKVFAPLSANPTLSGLNLSGRIMAHPGNGNLSQGELDEMMGRQMAATLSRDGKPDYQQAEDALMAEQLQFGNQINTQQTQPKEDDGFNLLDQEDNEFFLFGDDQNQTGTQNQPGSQNQGSNQNRINEEPFVNQSGGVLINDDVPAENPNKIIESSGNSNSINANEGIRQSEPQKVDISIKRNSWEYLDLNTTKIPKMIRNASDPEVVRGFLNDHGNLLTDQEKEYLAHKQQSLAKVRGKISAVQNSLKQGNYASAQMQPVIVEDEGIYVLPDIKQPSFQTSKNGCWSCFYQMALQSKGVEGLTQEDIRAYRPPLEDDDEFGNEADGEMNTDSITDAMDMGDLTLELLPNTMMKSVEIDTYHRYMGGKKEKDEDKLIYSENITNYVKHEIIDSIKNHHSPVGIMMDGHYITITGIQGDRVYFKNSMPSEM